MKYRFYQLYYLLSAVLLIVAMCKPVLNVMEPYGAIYALGNFTMLNPDGTTTAAVAALGVVLIVATLVNLFALFVSFFSNFELQKRASILSMLLLAGYYILLLLFLLLMLDTAVAELKAAVMIPLTVLILDMMGFLSARRTEAQILAKASGFRLRD
jgi:hypothetical protein